MHQSSDYIPQEEYTRREIATRRALGLRIALIAIWLLFSMSEMLRHQTPVSRFCDLSGKCWTKPAPPVQVERGDGR